MLPKCWILSYKSNLKNAAQNHSSHIDNSNLRNLAETEKSHQVLSACVALSSAQLVAYPNGAVVPADTAEVHAAKVAHAAAGGAVHPVHAFGYAAAYPYFGGLVGHANGAVVPADTPEVHAAKVAHAAAGGAVHHALGPYAYAAGYHGYAAGYPYAYHHGVVPVHAGFAGLVAHPNGAVVPVEPADVVAAREAHLAAHA